MRVIDGKAQPTMRQLLKAALTILIALAWTVGMASPAWAQGDDDDPAPGDRLGTADFRTAPLLGPGSYQDTIVSGSTVWYAVLYTNNQPYRFEADLPNTDLEAETQLDLQVSFVGPTLDPLDSGRLLEGSARYTGGGTNLWYLAVRLETEGRVGVEHELTLDIEGVGAGRLELCSDLDDCTFDDDLAALDADLAEAQTQLAELPGADAEAVIGGEISALEERRDQATEDLAAATSAVAELCAPADDCDEVAPPGSTTPLWGLALGGLVLLGGLAVLGLGIRRSR